MARRERNLSFRNLHFVKSCEVCDGGGTYIGCFYYTVALHTTTSVDEKECHTHINCKSGMLQ